MGKGKSSAQKDEIALTDNDSSIHYLYFHMMT